MNESEANPSVSVIIPTFNRARTILRAVDSVLEQTYRNFDIWIIDDGGTDGTEDILQDRMKAIKEVPIHYKRRAHSGAAGARNFGVRISNHPLIAFLDSDDLWYPEKLSCQIEVLRKNEKLALVHTGEDWIRNGKNVPVPKKYKKYAGMVYERCLPLCMIGPSTVLIRRDVFEKEGGFNESFPACEDYEFWLRLSLNWEVGLVEEPMILKFGGHADQLSLTTPQLDSWRIKALRLMLSRLPVQNAYFKPTLCELRRRGKILLNGYLKHGKKEAFRKLHSELMETDSEGFSYINRLSTRS